MTFLYYCKNNVYDIETSGNQRSKLKSVEINGIKYDIELFLVGDLKFLAIVSGLDSATSQYSCIWCKCPESEQCD